MLYTVGKSCDFKTVSPALRDSKNKLLLVGSVAGAAEKLKKADHEGGCLHRMKLQLCENKVIDVYIPETNIPSSRAAVIYGELWNAP